MISKKKVLISMFVGLALVGSNYYWYNQTQELQNKICSRELIIDALDISNKNQFEYTKQLQDELQKKDNEILELKDEVKNREAQQVSRGGREIDVEVTYYTHTGNPTASGVMPQAGVTAACNFIPLGSHVVIDGHEYIIQDTGGALGNNIIDIFVDSEEEAFSLGRQYTTARIL